MKKYWAWFVYNHETYLIMFRVKGSLQYVHKHHAFVDKDFYVRSVGEVIAMAAIDTHPLNDEKFNEHICGLISHDIFRDYRGRGYKRWEPKRPVIEWD